MRKMMNKKFVGFLAMALACVMIGSAVTVLQPKASAETQTVVLTSPFTEAIAAVRNSVVGVNNYQVVNNNYGSGNGNGYYNPWDDFFGFGFGYGYGNGRGGRNYSNPDAGKEVQYCSGSGVVVAEHYVLTNYHVVEAASSLKVSVGNGEDADPALFDATLVASDSDLDVAVLYVPTLNLAPVALGDSDKLQVGDWAICIGNPIGFTGTVTAGIVSGLDRAISNGTSTDKYGRKTEVTNSMIQTDAAINSGNSGGGMFNTAGELVGIPTLKYSGTRSNGASVESIGMCIPINDAKPVIEKALGVSVPAPETYEGNGNQNADKGLVGKPRMGVSIMTINTAATLDGSIPTGVYIGNVEAGSPAETAGLQLGDIVVEAEGKRVTTTDELIAIVSEKKAGDQITMTVFRTGVDLTQTNEISKDADYMDVTVTLAVVDAVAQ